MNARRLQGFALILSAVCLLLGLAVRTPPYWMSALWQVLFCSCWAYRLSIRLNPVDGLGWRHCLTGACGTHRPGISIEYCASSLGDAGRGHHWLAHH